MCVCLHIHGHTYVCMHMCSVESWGRCQESSTVFTEAGSLGQSQSWVDEARLASQLALGILSAFWSWNYRRTATPTGPFASVLGIQTSCWNCNWSFSDILFSLCLLPLPGKRSPLSSKLHSTHISLNFLNEWLAVLYGPRSDFLLSMAWPGPWSKSSKFRPQISIVIRISCLSKDEWTFLFHSVLNPEGFNSPSCCSFAQRLQIGRSWFGFETERIFWPLIHVFVFWDKVLLCRPGWPGNHHVHQVDLELGDLPAAIFPTLGLKMYATMPGTVNILKLLLLLYFKCIGVFLECMSWHHDHAVPMETKRGWTA